jgi:putative ABC transport system substrate-binding protein
VRRRDFIAGVGGAAAAWPLAARAQQPAVPTIGYLSGVTEGTANKFTAAFRQGLSEQGYTEGRNVEIVYRSAEGQLDRLPGMVADLVRRRVSVIVATTGAAQVAKAATTTIPIVFAVGADPVELGLVASLNRPGGNATGVSFLTVALTAKRIELLREVAPAATSVGFLVNPTNPQAETETREAENAARLLGLRLVTLNASTPNEIDTMLVNLAGQQIGALLVSADGLFMAQRDRLVALVARQAVPAIFYPREIVEVGGLMSYGASIADAYRVTGTYAGRVLKGEKPADLPVQQSVRIELIINLKTAKELGVTFPLKLLGRADEVIE